MKSIDNRGISVLNKLINKQLPGTTPHPNPQEVSYGFIGLSVFSGVALSLNVKACVALSEWH